jgi:hypothetical protein
MGEAAQNAKRHPQFTASYAAIARRRGSKIATTAIARKLLTRAWHLLTDAERAEVSEAHDTAAASPDRTCAPAPGGGRQAPGELEYAHEPATPRSVN